MVNTLLKGVLAAVAVKWLDSYQRLSVQLLRVEVAKSYLCGVRMARWSVISLIRLALILAMICFGLLLLHAGLLVLLPWSMKAKAIFGIFLGVFYLAIGGFVLRAAMSEKTWMDRSGASQKLKEVTGHSEKG